MRPRSRQYVVAPAFWGGIDCGPSGYSHPKVSFIREGRRTMYRAAAVTLLLVVAASARAQVIYAPVQYQYTNGMTYYYGGNDPSMLSYIEHVKCRNGYPSAVASHYSN